MIVITPTPEQKRQARKEAKEVGVLRNSITRGRGNGIGAMGEILSAEYLKGERVGMVTFSHDIVLKNGIKIDVKTSKANIHPPLPHYVARVYGSEEQAEKLADKCDVYFFVRCSDALSVATLIGWLPTKKFFEKALFTPRGHIHPDDKKLTYSDEFTVPISELYKPTQKITKKLLS